LYNTFSTLVGEKVAIFGFLALEAREID